MDEIKTRIGVWLLKPEHTKKELAFKLGMTPQTLTNRLDGTFPWRWSEVCALTEVIGCSLEELQPQ